MVVGLAVYLDGRQRFTLGGSLGMTIDHSNMLGHLDATTDTGLNVSGQPIFLAFWISSLRSC
jgi:hypothetical protein